MTFTAKLQTLCAPFICAVIIGLPTEARANPLADDIAGSVTATLGGQTISLPLLKSNYDVSIEGTLATVTVRQTFLNDGSLPINATYQFPLNQKAAVYSMIMKVGEEKVRAKIMRKEKALKTFAAAKKQGKTASLLKQHRPNIFTQNIANLMPKMPVTVTLKYVQSVPKKDGAYELVVPMVVGPRYEGEAPPKLRGDPLLGDNEAPAGANDKIKTQQVSGWTVAKLPAYPQVIGQDAPAHIDPMRVGFSLKLKSANRISQLTSSTHKLKVETSDHHASATFNQALEIDNRDLVVRYELGSKQEVSAGVLSHFDERGGFLSLEIEPPQLPSEENITPRELVFVLDTSGSMNGAPMEASKVFMRAALKNLRPSDHFRILRFSSNTSQFAQNAVPATTANVRRGINFVNGLSAGGGTEMNNAINAAFDMPPIDRTLRLVVFLTDGYIGADRHVINTISKRIGNARIYAFGIGNSVNRFLLDGMAKEGRGQARYVEVGEQAKEVAQALATQLNAPLLTDISINWNGLQVEHPTPSRLPDLFAGGSLRVLARYQSGGKHQVTLNGLVNGRPATMPIDLELREIRSDNDNPLPLIWARKRVFDLERDFTISGGKDEQAKEAITQLGLAYSLQTAFTSFVAVSEKIYNAAPSANKSASVPLPQVSGVSKNAYPSLNLSGSSTPEPGVLMGFMMAFILMLIRFRKRMTLRLARFRKHRARSSQRIPGLPKRLVNDAWWLKQ